MTDIMPRDEAQRLAKDCVFAAECLAETGTFETGQAILKDAARSLLAAHDEIDRLTRWRAEEGDKIRRQAKALTDLIKHCKRVEAERDGLARKVAAVQRSGDDLAHSELADLQARVHNQRQEIARLRTDVSRDRLAAANAALEAKLARLVGARDG